MPGENTMVHTCLQRLSSSTGPTNCFTICQKCYITHSIKVWIHWKFKSSYSRYQWGKTMKTHSKVCLTTRQFSVQSSWQPKLTTLYSNIFAILFKLDLSQQNFLFLEALAFAHTLNDLCIHPQWNKNHKVISRSWFTISINSLSLGNSWLQNH